MLIREILGAPALPFTWINNHVAVFSHGDVNFAILIERYPLHLLDRPLTVGNIAFGVIVDKTKPITSANIDKSLTGHQVPLTIMSTVADAVLSNKSIASFDVLTLGASDNRKDKRIKLYAHALNEVGNRLPGYNHTFLLQNQSGALIVALSKTDFTSEEQQILGTELNISKH